MQNNLEMYQEYDLDHIEDLEEGKINTVLSSLEERLEDTIQSPYLLKVLIAFSGEFERRSGIAD
jgi:hypothetical protein